MSTTQSHPYTLVNSTNHTLARPSTCTINAQEHPPWRLRYTSMPMADRPSLHPGHGRGHLQSILQPRQRRGCHNRPMLFSPNQSRFRRLGIGRIGRAGTARQRRKWKDGHIIRKPQRSVVTGSCGWVMCELILLFLWISPVLTPLDLPTRHMKNFGGTSTPTSLLPIGRARPLFSSSLARRALLSIYHLKRIWIVQWCITMENPFAAGMRGVHGWYAGSGARMMT